MSDMKNKSLGYGRDFGIRSTALNYCKENGMFDPTNEQVEIDEVVYDLEFLYKHHFDVNGLISKGLAVSIHDIKTKG